MKYRNLFFHNAAVRLAWLALAFHLPASATTYLYSGPTYPANAIANATTPDFTTSMQIAGFIATSAPVPPNKAAFDIGANGANLLQNAAFNNGLGQFTLAELAGPNGPQFLVDTDANGNIVGFAFGFQSKYPQNLGSGRKGYLFASTMGGSFTVGAGAGLTICSLLQAGNCTVLNPPANTVSMPGAQFSGAFTTAAGTRTITPSAGIGGKISPNTPQTVARSATTIFTLTPDPSYNLDGIVGVFACGGGVLTQNGSTAQLTIFPGASDCAVHADFTTSATLNGACGSDNGKALSAPPVNLCSVGAAGAVVGGGPWSWTCNGVNGGNNATCSAQVAASTLSISDASADEGNAGMKPFVFTVTLYPAQPLETRVDYATVDGTATVGSDYQATSGTLSFAPGETSKTITVNVIGDTTVEPDEVFYVDLSNAVNIAFDLPKQREPSASTARAAVSLGKSRGTGTIRNDDAAPPRPEAVAAPALDRWTLGLLVLGVLGCLFRRHAPR
jgi:hypothetical protein